MPLIKIHFHRHHKLHQHRSDSQSSEKRGDIIFGTEHSVFPDLIFKVAGPYDKIMGIQAKSHKKSHSHQYLIFIQRRKKLKYIKFPPWIIYQKLLKKHQHHHKISQTCAGKRSHDQRQRRKIKKEHRADHRDQHRAGKAHHNLGILLYRRKERHLRPNDHHNTKLHQIHDPVKTVRRNVKQINKRDPAAYQDQPEDQSEKGRHDPIQLLLINTIRYIAVNKHQHRIGKNQRKNGDIGYGI